MTIFDNTSKLREIKNATPKQLREEFDKHVTFIQQQDSENLDFALMITGHNKGNDGIHTYSMLGGPSDTIAAVVMQLMDELVSRDPSLALFFFGSFIQRMKKSLSNAAQAADDNQDIETQTKDLIDKLRGGTPPKGNIH
ncbi:MAG: hypothetical protein BWY66_02788 [bacterium ADurb.Bin374]|nr:MAG: hypothetical protein BWY66_02788 [bacterium ADurb.Bin374]